MYNRFDYTFLAVAASKKEAEWIRFFNKKKKKIESADLQIHDLHDRISSKINCLDCGNCCRTLGPRITDKDVERISKTLRIKQSELIEKYLRVDEDRDLVFKTMPCPFLGDDNYCSIYESRPKACREYPHTDRKKFHQIYKLSVKNASTCPIVFEVLDGISKL